MNINQTQILQENQHIRSKCEHINYHTDKWKRLKVSAILNKEREGVNTHMIV